MTTVYAEMPCIIIINPCDHEKHVYDDEDYRNNTNNDTQQQKRCDEFVFFLRNNNNQLAAAAAHVVTVTVYDFIIMCMRVIITVLS